MNLRVVFFVLAASGCGNAMIVPDASVPSPDLLSPAPVALTPDPEIAQLAIAPDAARISTTETTLAGFPTRNTCSDGTGMTPGIGSARDFLQAQLALVPGLTVRLDPFSYSGCGAPTTRHNVIAWLPGAHPDRLIVIGGHYDSRTVDVLDGVSPSPGANDSGSQTAVVLEAARTLAAHSYDATLVFASFAAEEQGLIGSSSFAANLARYFPTGTVEAMLNCDIVGGDSSVNDAAALGRFRLFSPGTPREIHGPDGTTDDTSPSRGLMRHVGEWGALYLPSLVMEAHLREDRPGRGGDHESFIARALPGVRFIDPAENLLHQHTADDRLTYLTPSYTARVAGVVVASAASLARAPSSPRALTVTGGAGGMALVWTAPATGPAVDHYVVAARPAAENLYRTRLAAQARAANFSAADLSVTTPFFLSVAAVDTAGHESLFAYPEWRCDDAGCAVPPAALNVTVTDK